jgi:hypothetical protein
LIFCPLSAIINTVRRSDKPPNFLKNIFQKTLDKHLKVCYNRLYNEREVMFIEWKN